MCPPTQRTKKCLSAVQTAVLDQLVSDPPDRKSIVTCNSFTVEVLWELQCCFVLFQHSVAMTANTSTRLVLGGPSVCPATQRTTKLHSVVQTVVLDQLVSDPLTESQI